MTRDNERAVFAAQAGWRSSYSPTSDRQVHLARKLETLKPGWWLWDCEVEYPDGSIKQGSIQSDGHNHALETFEVEEEL